MLDGKVLWRKKEQVKEAGKWEWVEVLIYIKWSKEASSKIDRWACCVLHITITDD